MCCLAWCDQLRCDKLKCPKNRLCDVQKAPASAASKAPSRASSLVSASGSPGLPMKAASSGKRVAPVSPPEQNSMQRAKTAVSRPAKKTLTYAMPPGVSVTQILKCAVPTAKTASNAPVFLPSSVTASVANASDFAERGEDSLRLHESTPFIYAKSTCDRRRSSALGKRTRTQRTI